MPKKMIGTSRPIGIIIARVSMNPLLMKKSAFAEKLCAIIHGMDTNQNRPKFELIGCMQLWITTFGYFLKTNSNVDFSIIDNGRLKERMERDLERAMEIVVDRHNKKPYQYYLGEGDKEGIEDCKVVLKLLHLLSRQCSESFLQDPTAIPIHELFRTIKAHLDQIQRFYISKETELYQEILKRLLPSNPNPLRFIVLSSMSLFTARVYLHSKELSPDPIQAYVDGYFNLVIDLTDNVVRIPLLPDSVTHDPPALPPTLRFKGINAEDEERIKRFVFEEAPTMGRKNQLTAFISVLNSNRPSCDYLTSFKYSLTSLDMSFATALCALVTEPVHFSSLCALFNILGVEGALDLFIRELACSATRIIQGFQVSDSVDLVALTNFFIALSGEWASKLRCRSGQLVHVIKDICGSISHQKVTQEALYVLRAALVIAAYDDTLGASPISMFLEVAVRPFAVAFGVVDQLELLKRSLLVGDASASEERSIIERAIVELLGSEITADFSPRSVDSHLRDVHELINARIDDFIDLVIALNQRPKLEHPAMTMLMFAYTMAAKHGLIE